MLELKNSSPPNAITNTCPSCSKAIPRDSQRCPYCEVVIKWALTGKLRPNWQMNIMLGPILLVGPLKKRWFRCQLLNCQVDWDIITLNMGDGTTYKLKRGEYKGSWRNVGSLPIMNFARWQLEIKPTGGKTIVIDTLLVEYPEGEESLKELANVLGVEKNKWAALLEILEVVVKK